VLHHPIDISTPIIESTFRNRIFVTSLIDVPNKASISHSTKYLASNGVSTASVNFQRELFVQENAITGKPHKLLDSGLNSGKKLNPTYNGNCFSVWTDPDKIFPTADGQADSATILVFIGGALVTASSSNGDFVSVPIGYFYKLSYSEFTSFRI